MRTEGLRRGSVMLGALLVSLACGETEKDSDGMGMDGGSSGSDGSGGSAGNGGVGGDTGGPTTVSNTGTSNAATHTAASSSGTVGPANSAGGASSSASSTGVVGAGGGMSTTGSSVGGAGGIGAAGGAGGPAITECGGCETTTEPFGEGCQVWVCFGPGDGPTRLIDAGCMDLATQVPRFCCPPEAELDCD